MRYNLRGYVGNGDSVFGPGQPVGWCDGVAVYDTAVADKCQKLYLTIPPDFVGGKIIEIPTTALLVGAAAIVYFMFRGKP